MIEVGVTINMDASARETATVDETGVIPGVAEDGVVTAGEVLTTARFAAKPLLKTRADSVPSHSASVRSRRRNGGVKPGDERRRPCPAAIALRADAAARAKRGSAARPR